MSDAGWTPSGCTWPGCGTTLPVGVPGVQQWCRPPGHPDPRAAGAGQLVPRLPSVPSLAATAAPHPIGPPRRDRPGNGVTPLSSPHPAGHAPPQPGFVPCARTAPFLSTSAPRTRRIGSDGGRTWWGQGRGRELGAGTWVPFSCSPHSSCPVGRGMDKLKSLAGVGVGHSVIRSLSRPLSGSGSGGEAWGVK